MGVQAPNRLAAAGAAAVLLAACGSISAPDRHQPLAPAAASASDPTHSAGPGPRILAGMAYHEASQTVVLFGGQGATDYLNDTWTWNGQRWLQQHPAVSPPPRYGAGMVYDAATKTVVLFGGTGWITSYLIGPLSDTWTWNGTTWTQQHPTVTPPARNGFGMAYDVASGEVVLFGGDGGTRVPTFLNDTWVWNGINWSQRQPGVSPAGRVEASLAYDAVSNQLVLFGGANGMTLGDTWIWAGQTWTKRFPSRSPGPRYSAGSAYSSVNGKVLVFGGYDANSVRLDETWAWNGNTWTQLLVSSRPERRVLASLSADGAGGVVLFGGSGERPKTVSNLLDDSWSWDGRSWRLAK